MAEEYPLTGDELQEGRYYECANHTIVLCMSKGSFVPVNDRNCYALHVANGVGHYAKLTKFRGPLTSGYICIDLNEKGFSEQDKVNFFPMPEEKA
jgi:hypothetical protein